MNMVGPFFGGGRWARAPCPLNPARRRLHEGDDDDGGKVLIIVADKLIIDIHPEDIQNMHWSGQNAETKTKLPRHCKFLTNKNNL